MKSTVFATLAGLSLAGQMPSNTLSFNTNSNLNPNFSNSNSFSSSASNSINTLSSTNSGSTISLGSGQYGVGGLGTGSISGSGYSMGSIGAGSGLSSSGALGAGGAGGVSSLGNVGIGSGGSTLGVTSYGAVNTGVQGLSSGTGLSNIGTGAVLVSPALTGTQIKSGTVITNGQFPKADISLLSSVSSSVINNNNIASGILANSRLISGQYGSATRSINSLFYKLPSSADIDNMIISADSAALIRTIQAIGTDDSLPCDQRIAYLLEMLGRLKAAVAKKAYASGQVKIIIDAAAKEVTRLQGLIDGNNAAITRLGIDALKKQLQALLNTLQDTYIKYNTVQSQIPTIEAQINGNSQQILILNKNSDAIRNSIANDKIKITGITAQVNSVQARIKQLQDRQAALEASIARGEANIANNDNALADLNAKIDSIQQQIRDLTDNADRFSSQAKDLEVKVSRLRTQISVNQTKRTRIMNENYQLEDRLAIERKKVVPNDLQAINDMIGTLRNLVPKIQSEIDRHYYYCFGEGKVQVQRVGGVVVYIVRGEAFENYLKNIYGKGVRIPKISTDVAFNKVDIFGQNWVGAFGYPFSQNAFGTQDLSLAGSFGCTNPSALAHGSGTITAIGADYIQSMDEQSNQRRRFKLGSCSRLQSTKRVPAVGQRFFYSGVPDGNGFNLYTGSCMD